MSSLETLAEAWTRHAWSMACVFTVACALIAVLRRPLRRAFGAEPVPLLWLLVPLALLATGLPHPAAPIAAMPPVVVRIAGGGSWVPPAMSTAWHVPWQVLAMLGWLVGVLTVAVLIGVAQSRYARRLRTALPMAGAGAGWPVWLAGERDLGPAMVGAWRVRIVLPVDFETRYSPTEQALILAHERVHARRRDGLWRLLAQSLVALFWFHPLAWYALACLRQDQELACDAVVLREHDAPRRDYASAMLKTQSSPLLLPVGCSWSSRHPFTERIAMLKQPVPARARRIAAHAALGAIVLVGSLGVYATQSAASHPAGMNDGHFTLKVDIATRGHAPSMHFTQCLAKGKPYDVSGSDGPDFSWHGQFVVTPMADGQLQIASDLQTRLDEGNGNVRSMSGKPIVRTRPGQPAGIVFGQTQEKPLKDGSVRIDLTAVPGCGAEALAVLPQLAPIDEAAKATPVRAVARSLAEKGDFTLVNPEALSTRTISLKFEQMSPIAALQLVADIDGKRAVFDGRSVRFDPK